MQIYRAKDVAEKGFLRLKRSLDLGRLRVHSEDRMLNNVVIKKQQDFRYLNPSGLRFCGRVNICEAWVITLTQRETGDVVTALPR